MFPIVLLGIPALAEPKRVTGIGSHPIDITWRVVNDTVMGGRSKSGVILKNGQMQFSGSLNTNGGGFASLRSDPQEWDLSEFSVVRLKVRGDGRTYRFRLFVVDDRASYQNEFETVDGEWQIVELAIDEFYAAWRGQRLRRPPLAASQIAGIGLILADGVDGPFTLTVDWIEFDHTPTQKQSG